MLDSIVKVLKQYDELETADVLLDTFAKYAHNLEEYDTIAKNYNEIKQYKKAIKYGEKCLAIANSNEQLYSVRANLAKMCNHINDPRASLRYSNINEKIKPNDFDIQMEKVFSHYLLNEKDKSEAILRTQIARDDLDEKQKKRILFNLGTYDLKHGLFKQALKEFYIVGKEIEIWPSPKLPGEFWSGGVYPDKTLVLFAEGGIGDELINVRFCKMIESLGMKTIWYTTRKFLKDILERAGTTVVSDIKMLPENYMWTYSMSLPIYLDLDTPDLWKGPYITAKQEYVDKWSHIKNNNGKLKVGIRWSGNPRYEQDLHRSVDLPAMYEAIKDMGFELYSLQKDNDLEVLKDYPDIIDLSEQLETFEDTLGVIENLDFVISSCTSIAHASAATDKKTYIMVPIAAYYTWESTADETTPWYGKNTILIRQSEHKSWTKPIAELVEYLKKEVS